jgi:hypothetical protein
LHGSLGTSPARIVFGKSIDLDRGFIPLSQHEIPVVATAAEKFLEITMEDQAMVIARTQALLNKHELAYAALNGEDNEAELVIFPINSYVLALYPESRGALDTPTKLHMRWKGPLKVVSIDGNMYSLLNLATGLEERIHIKRLKAFHYDPAHTVPEQVAYGDEQFWEVEAVLKHRGFRLKRTTMEFLIKWVGFEHPEWQPWGDYLRDNSIMHEYLRTHGMSTYIPKKFQAS